MLSQPERIAKLAISLFSVGRRTLLLVSSSNPHAQGRGEHAVAPGGFPRNSGLGSFGLDSFVLGFFICRTDSGLITFPPLDSAFGVFQYRKIRFSVSRDSCVVHFRWAVSRKSLPLTEPVFVVVNCHIIRRITGKVIPKYAHKKNGVSIDSTILGFKRMYIAFLERHLFRRGIDGMFDYFVPINQKVW